MTNNDSYDLYDYANILLSIKNHYMIETTGSYSDNIIKKTTNSIPCGSKVKIIKDTTYKSFTGTIVKSKNGFYTVLLDNILIEIKVRWHEFQVILL